MRFSVTYDMSKSLYFIHTPFLLMLVQCLEIHSHQYTANNGTRVNHLKGDVSGISNREADDARAHSKRITITKLHNRMVLINDTVRVSVGLWRVRHLGRDGLLGRLCISWPGVFSS